VDADDKARVEAALAGDAKLWASLRLVEEDRAETIGLNQAIGAPGSEAWSRVFAVVEAEPRKPSLKSRFAALLNSAGLGAEPNRGRMAWAGVAAVLVIAVQAAAIVSLLPGSKAPGYQTASDQSAPVEGTTVLMQFAPDTRLDQLTAVLQKHAASIVDGPRGGMYRVRVGDKSMTRDQLDAAVAAFRAEPVVKLVLPSAGK
jgi:hypothetical protein